MLINLNIYWPPVLFTSLDSDKLWSTETKGQVTIIWMVFSNYRAEAIVVRLDHSSLRSNYVTLKEKLAIGKALHH